MTYKLLVIRLEARLHPNIGFTLHTQLYFTTHVVAKKTLNIHN